MRLVCEDSKAPCWFVPAGRFLCQSPSFLFTLRWVVSDFECTPWAYGCEVFEDAEGLASRLEDLAVDMRSGEFVDGGAPVFDEFDGVPSLDDVMRSLSK